VTKGTAPGPLYLVEEDDWSLVGRPCPPYSFGPADAQPAVLAHPADDAPEGLATLGSKSVRDGRVVTVRRSSPHSAGEPAAQKSPRGT